MQGLEFVAIDLAQRRCGLRPAPDPVRPGSHRHSAVWRTSFYLQSSSRNRFGYPYTRCESSETIRHSATPDVPPVPTARSKIARCARIFQRLESFDGCRPDAV